MWTGSEGSSTEETRAFFQARLSTLGLWMFALAGGTWALLGLVHVVCVIRGLPSTYSPISAGGVLHLWNGLLAGALWLATRRGVRSEPQLNALDFGVSLGLMTVWALTGSVVPGASGTFIALLSYVLGTLARAIVVPSSAGRTLAISLLGGGLIVAVSIWNNAKSGQPASNSIAAACWTASAIALAALASQTIFGLRREVREARVLGQYTLETKLGEGGMGTVWRANHALLRRPTAIKLLPPARMGEAAIRRFEREVQFSAQLTHPNSVAIYDYGRTRDGIFYYAMELLEGLDLERLVTQHGAQPPGRVVHVLRQVCGALAEAHDMGLVHRDVKPANVILSPRKHEHEFAKIVDYGLAKQLELGGGLTAASGMHNLIAGTPLYMSPEAIQTPERVDPRSDLYSLGALAWFLLVGRPPFEGASLVEVCGKHLHTTPLRPSVALGSALPTDLEDGVLACLAKQPSDRPPDARALRGFFEHCSAAEQWSADQAAEFWRSCPEGTPPHERPASALARTVALDVAARTNGNSLG